MSAIGFISILILVITMLTIVFGTLAYFLYKVRERKRKSAKPMSYEEILEKEGGEFVFFE